MRLKKYKQSFINYNEYPFTLHQWLILSSGFSCFLLLIRMVSTGTFNYIFLPWNLFLAFVPYYISSYLIKPLFTLSQKVLFIIIFLGWLLFIPNSFYIITDLFHLKSFPSAPEWFDLLLIFSFAWNGIILGILSIIKVEIIFEKISKKKVSFILVFCVMFLSSLGVYIGRFLRFNSWDVVSDPFTLFSEIIDLITNPYENNSAWAMTLGYAIFMTFVYYITRNISVALIKKEGLPQEEDLLSK